MHKVMWSDASAKGRLGHVPHSKGSTQDCPDRFDRSPAVFPSRDQLDWKRHSHLRQDMADRASADGGRSALKDVRCLDSSAPTRFPH